MGRVGWALAQTGLALGAICTGDVIFILATQAIYDTIARFSLIESITDLGMVQMNVTVPHQ